MTGPYRLSPAGSGDSWLRKSRTIPIHRRGEMLTIIDRYLNTKPGRAERDAERLD